MTRKTNKCLSLFLTFALVFGLIAAAAPQPVNAAEPTTLAEWTLTGALDPSPGTQATGGVKQNESYLSSTATYSGFTANNGTVYYNNWTVGGYWEIITSPRGYRNLELRFASYGSNTGPKNFAAYFSIDGESFEQIPGSEYSLSSTATSGVNQNISILLPSDLYRADELRIRLQVEDSTSINDGALAGTGTSRIGNVSLTGDHFSGPVEDGGGDGDGDSGDPDPGTPVTPIAEARAQVTGSSAIVEGVVARAIQSSATNATNCTLYIQDDTGGIAVFVSGVTLATFEIGARVRVSGALGVYTGLIQLQPATLADIEVLPDPPAPLTPETGTIEQLNTLAYEGKLIKLEGVKLTTIATNSNHTIQDPADGAQTTMRCTAGSTLPGDYALGDIIDVVGVAANYNGTAQFMVSAFSDISRAALPPEPDTSDVDGAGPIAEWNLSEASGYVFGASIDATGGDSMSGAALQFIKNGVPQSLNFSSGGANLSGLNGSADNAWWYATTSSAGFANIEVSWNMRSSATGPRDFKLQYSADGTTWFDAIDPAVIVPSAVAIGETKYKKSLPEGANNLDTLYLRWLLTSDVSANGGSIGSGGTHQINYIVVSGGYILGADQLRRPVADPAGGAVPLGQPVAFAPGSEEDAAVDGYAVLVSDDDGANWFAPDAYQYTISLLPLTLLAKASAPGMTDSRVSAYTFTQAKLPIVTASVNSGAVLPGITVALKCQVDGATILYSVNGGPEQAYTGALALAEGLFIGDPAAIVLRTRAIMEGYIDGDPVTYTYTKQVAGGEKIYFGQLHSHTINSDGQGTLEEAFAWARDHAGLDFFAVTDHSNSFDTAPANDNPAAINLDTYNENNARWQAGRDAADAARTDSFISVYGYEMTWSGGPGHINTFNTGGFVSRNNNALNNKSSDAGMRAYYELLTRTPNSISMFNHPGTTFGNFNNFAYYDPVVDERITLLEVGNGEGAIGSGGYFRSYEQYTMALDKGWHVAPANNQDNHLRNWGDSNTCRDAIWTNDLSVEGLYQALRDMRVYATEVKDLEIVYKVNGLPLGTILDEAPQTANFTAEIKNPTEGNVIKSVSLITNGGVEILAVSPGARNYDYDQTLDNPAAGYYYLKVVVSTPEGDRYAVTAPVWLGEGKAAGFVDVAKSALMAVTGEDLELKARFFNNEGEAATLKSLEFRDQDGSVLGSFTDLNMAIASKGEISQAITYTPTQPGDTAVTVTAILGFADGMDITYTYDLNYTVWDADALTYIGVDASHYNEYVDGNYKDNMVNFATIAADFGVRVHILWTSSDLVAAAANPKYQALILTAPSRRVDPAATNPTTGQVYGAHRTYSQPELDAIAVFAQGGGTVVLAGWSNVYESYTYTQSMALGDHMAAQQNKVLAAIGSTLRLSDDAATDSNQWSSASDPYRLYLTDGYGSYNWDNPLLEGAVKEQIFSQYGGSTIYTVAPADKGAWDAAPSAVLPEGVIPAIMLSSAGESVNRETYPQGTNYRADYTKIDGKFMVLASEAVDHGGATSLVIAAGGAFMSNFEVKLDMDNIWSLQYSNYNIALNLIKAVAPERVIIPIAEAKGLPEGASVVVEGIATSNVYSGDNATNTGFFDCIYMQDDTGGVNLFPVSSGVTEGQKIRVSGKISSYQGETQIAVTSFEVVDAAITKAAPTAVTTEQAMDPAYTGLLVTLTGEVTEVVSSGDVVDQFSIMDASGVEARIYINAYITSDADLSFVKVGNTVSVTGLASIGENRSSGDPLPRIRVRDRGEILFVAEPEEPTPDIYTVTFALNGGIRTGGGELVQRIIEGGSAIAPVVSRSGYTFNGWDADFTAIASDITATAQWTPRSGGSGDDQAAVGGGPAGGPAAPQPPLVEIESGQTPLAAFTPVPVKYLNGYPDGSISPDKPVSRAEICAILLRLLSAEEPEGAADQSFTDVREGDWFYQAVIRMAGLGVAGGYPDGGFKPDAAITRAEFAAMLSRLENLAPGESGAFTDISGHWAEANILSAAAAGWVAGYPDGTFRPDNPLTRAEAVAIINRMLQRAPDLSTLPDDAPTYPDLDVSHWAYADIMEASVERR